MKIQEIKPKITTLKNGVRIILMPKKSSLAASIGIFVGTGGSYESRNESGISHFLEHTLFNGTKSRPTYIDVSSALEGIGASFNGSTSYDYTAYYSNSAYIHFEKNLEILSDMFLNSLITPGFEKERAIIVEEINMYEDDPQSKSSDELMKLLFNEWGNILGTKSNILRFTPRDLKEYKKQKYTGKNVFVVVSGNFNNNLANKIIKDKFSKISSGDRNLVKDLNKVELSFNNLKIINRKLGQYSLSMGARSFPASDDRSHIARLLSVIMGGSLSSRLSKTVRYKLGAAYFIYSSNSSNINHGVFAIHAGIAKDKIKESVSAIYKEIDDIIKNGPSEKELDRAKKNLNGHIILSNESTGGIMMDAGKDIIKYGEIKTISSVIDKINSVTKKDIQSVAKEIFKKGAMRTAIVGPKKGLEGIEKLIK